MITAATAKNKLNDACKLALTQVPEFLDIISKDIEHAITRGSDNIDFTLSAHKPFRSDLYSNIASKLRGLGYTVHVGDSIEINW